MNATPPSQPGVTQQDFALDLRNALLKLARATPGMLETVDVKNEGVYGDGGPYGTVGFLSYALVNSAGDTIADTLNSGHVVVEEEHDDEGERIAWDDIGERNTAALVACWNFLRKHGEGIAQQSAQPVGDFNLYTSPMIAQPVVQGEAVAWLAEQTDYLPGDGKRELTFTEPPKRKNWRITTLLKGESRDY